MDLNVLMVSFNKEGIIVMYRMLIIILVLAIIISSLITYIIHFNNIEKSKPITQRFDGRAVYFESEKFPNRCFIELDGNDNFIYVPCLEKK